MHFLRESFSSVAKYVGIGIAVFVISVGISILISGPIVDYTFPPRKHMPGFLIFPANSGNQLVLFLWLFDKNEFHLLVSNGFAVSRKPIRAPRDC